VITRGRHKDVDEAAELVDRPVDVAPATAHLHILFVFRPAVTDRVPAGMSGVGEQGCEAQYPAVDTDVIDGDTPFGQKFLDVAVGQAVAQVPAHRHGDDLGRKAEAREG
jgi:hypothetical protein